MKRWCILILSLCSIVHRGNSINIPYFNKLFGIANYGDVDINDHNLKDVDYGDEGFGRDENCPKDFRISPCECQDPNIDLITIDCSNATSDLQLTTAFRAEFPVQELCSFLIQDNDDIREIKNIFNNVTFERFNFKNVSSLKSIDGDAFVDSKDRLIEIYVADGNLNAESFPIAFNEYPKLVSVTIENEEFDTVPVFNSELFQETSFRNNKISSIETGAFKNTPILTYVNLEYNVLETLEPEVFHLPNNYIELELSYNMIHTVQPGAFVLPDHTEGLMIVIFMPSNNLTVIDEAAFGAIFPFVGYLNLEDNPLDCGCNIAWLVLNSDYLSHVTSSTACANGTQLQSLDPTYYQINC